MPNYKALLNEAKIIIEDIAKACSSDEAYFLYSSKLFNHYDKSEKTDQDKKELVADASFLFWSYKANSFADSNDKFNHLPKIISGGRGAIKALTDEVYDCLFETLNQKNSNKKMENFADNVKYHYKADINKVADPVKKVWKALHEMLEEKDFGFHSEN